jgi:transcriptional regulator with XRE-family HTH domain
MGIYANEFSEVFSALLQKTNVSCYQISQYTHLNQAYLSRLKAGEKQNPSPETLIKISLAFTHFSDKVRLHDIQSLFRSVGRSLNVAEEW